MGEIVVLSSDDGMETNEETMMNLSKPSELVRWEKYLPKTVLRVLLVESDDSTRQIITSLLRKCCYKVVAVSDGLAAWETLKKKSHNIDLILTELDLPSISGFALLALVMEHEACKNIPVIMMSSQDSITMVLKCMLRGAADYLIKPIRKNELKNLWQHVWRRLTMRDHPTANAHSLPVSQQNLEDTETIADSRYHSDQGSDAQTISYNSQNKITLMADVNSGRIEKKVESFDLTMDLIGGIDKRVECFHGNKTRDKYVGPELGLSLKSETTEKGVVVLQASSSGEPKTPSESHEKLRCDHGGSATTSSNHENIIRSSNLTGQCNQNELRSPVKNQNIEKPKEEESLNDQQRWSQREAALIKFRLKRKDRCFDKKVRYQSRRKLAEQRPRVKGQFVRVVNSDASTEIIKT